MDNCRSYVLSSKPVRLRRLFSEIPHHVWSSDEGEFAAVGTFIPGWVARVDDGEVRSAQDLTAVKNLLRVVACGKKPPVGFPFFHWPMEFWPFCFNFGFWSGELL